MGGGGSSSAPTFNAQQTAQQQTQSNVQTGVANSILNNTNQVTPYGNLTYAQTGTTNVGGNDVPSYTATQTLSPEQQSMLQRQNNLSIKALDTADPVLGNIYNTIQKPLSFSGAPSVSESGLFGQLPQKAVDAASGLGYQGPSNVDQANTDAYNALTSRSNIDLGRARDAQNVQLANQGIAPGSEAWNRATEMQDRAVTDASNQATINAGTIASQNVNNAANISGAKNAAAGQQGNLWTSAANIAGTDFSQQQALRNQYINETTAQRNSPLQDYSTLMGFSGITQPQFTNTPQGQIPQTDVTMPAIAQFQGQQNAWNQQQQNSQATQGGLFGLGGGILGGLAQGWGRAGFPLPSDARIKENVSRVGTTENGFGIYAYNHIGDPTRRVGLMAQEVEKARPDAVVEIGGIKHIYYDRALCP